MCLSLFPLVTFYFFPPIYLFGLLFLSLTTHVSSFLQRCLSVLSLWLLWPTCGFIGQLSDEFRSILFNGLLLDVRKMSYLLQLSLQKYSKLLPAVWLSDGLQECNSCSSVFWMSRIVREGYPVSFRETSVEVLSFVWAAQSFEKHWFVHDSWSQSWLNLWLRDK